MSQGRSSPDDGSSCKVNEPRPPVEVERIDSNGKQTVIGFSGIGVDGAAIALPREDVTVDEALEIAHDVIDVAGGVA